MTSIILGSSPYVPVFWSVRGVSVRSTSPLVTSNSVGPVLSSRKVDCHQDLSVIVESIGGFKLWIERLETRKKKVLPEGWRDGHVPKRWQCLLGRGLSNAMSLGDDRRPKTDEGRTQKTKLGGIQTTTGYTQSIHFGDFLSYTNPSGQY